jgi:hypothetical protein
MKEVTAMELMQVIGGTNTVAQKKLDQQTELALTKLNTDLKDLAKPQQTQSQQMMQMMMMAMMMKR